MSRFTFRQALFLVALLALATFGLGKGRAQMHRESHPVASDLAAATSRNVLLSNDLAWKFGNKAQRGWYLYTPLISRSLNTSNAVGSIGFAKSLAVWQRKLALQPTGVLDEPTLYEMIKVWQGARLKDREVASPDKLVLVPISEFYDPTRAEELRWVERRTYQAYKKMVAAAVADRSLGLAHGAHGELATGEKFLKIVSAFRSREYQEKLRRESPNSGSAGLAVNSPHFTGRALDLYVGGEPVDTLDANRKLQVETRVYKWLVQHAERFGFRPYFYEPWHWEYVK
uniref:Putative penicillin-resistance DD-carboxypeptidase n=1 Tax=uncultured bacterium 253 TaxID=698385 RepID=E3T737_9BACT|nr:putative penicillin-resistance DD-carboxypeptidase [uncultured bacterium 253]